MNIHISYMLYSNCVYSVFFRSLIVFVWWCVIIVYFIQFFYFQFLLHCVLYACCIYVCYVAITGCRLHFDHQDLAFTHSSVSWRLICSSTNPVLAAAVSYATVRRRCDFLAISAPFANTQTELNWIKNILLICLLIKTTTTKARSRIAINLELVTDV